MAPLVAKDIMSSPVITIQDDAIISNFITVLLDNGISGVPVINKQGKLIGIITKTDLITFELERVLTNLYEAKLHKIIDEVNDDKPSLYKQTQGDPTHRSLLVKDMMIHAVVSATEETSIKEICTLMKTNKIRHVVVTNDHAVMGIITATDIIKLVSNSKNDLQKEDFL